jgi:hypothetical protein
VWSAPGGLRSDEWIRRPWGRGRAVTQPLRQVGPVIDSSIPGRWVRFCQIRSVALRAPSPWFTGAIAHWSAPDRADRGRLLGRFADDVTAHLTTLEDR